MTKDAMLNLSNFFKCTTIDTFKRVCEERKIKQKYQILAVLWDNKEHHYDKLNKIGYRYGSVINRLKKVGIDIVNRNEDGIYYYKMLTSNEIIELSPIGKDESILL